MFTLYELRGANPQHRFSPFCWRVRFALQHKHLAANFEAIGFTEKDKISQSGQGKVPVLVDGDNVISDSLEIFKYLDKNYLQYPLLGDDIACARAEALVLMASNLLMPGLMKLVMTRVHAVIRPEDQDYFRTTREKFFGQPLESYCNTAESANLLKPAFSAMADVLRKQSFFDGTEPAGSDYLIAGYFMWTYILGFEPWSEEEPVNNWFQRLLQRYEAEFGHVTRTTDPA